MRRRTITLVVVGLVLALFVLPAAAQVLLDADEPVVEATETEHVYTIDPDYDADLMYLLFGFIDNDEDPCEGVVILEDPADDEEVIFESDGAPVDELPPGCLAVDVTGPNEQVNHGQVVSNFVKALKGIHIKGTHGPFGQFVKVVAGTDFGKVDADLVGASDIATLDLDPDDGDGPPDHANGNSKKPKKNK